MYKKTIQNTSKGIFKKLFGKEKITALALTDGGFEILFEKSEPIAISFDQVKAVKVDSYLEKIAALRILTVVTQDKEYSLDADPYNGDVQAVLDHFAQHQLGGALPDKIEDIDLILHYGVNDNYYKLEQGNLVEMKNGNKTLYPMDEMEYYKVDAPSGLIQLKFPSKKLFVALPAIHVTNVKLLLDILDKFAPTR